jgi:hypothetical protein
MKRASPTDGPFTTEWVRKMALGGPMSAENSWVRETAMAAGCVSIRAMSRVGDRILVLTDDGIYEIPAPPKLSLWRRLKRWLA